MLCITAAGIRASKVRFVALGPKGEFTKCMRAIFVSYRRDDSEGEAGRLYDDLKRSFGDSAVFMDVSAIEPGLDFRKVIDESVASCGVLLAVIGPRWLDAIDEAGHRRLDNAGDFVRLETAAALKRDIPVVPVLVHGARMPRADQLPEDLRELSYRNGVELTHARWDSDVELLVNALKRHVEGEVAAFAEVPRTAPADQSSGAAGNALQLVPRKERERLIAGALVVAASAALGLYLWINGSGTRPPVFQSEVAQFVSSPALTSSMRTQLESALRDYAGYLARLGLGPRSVVVHVQYQLPEPGYHSYLNGNDIFVLPDYASPANVLHEYSHAVLSESVSGDYDQQWAYSAIEAGIANYFTADFLKSPILEGLSLEQRVPISDVPHTFEGGQGQGGAAWGSFLWALRRQFGSERTNLAIARAWGAIHPTLPPQDYQEVFLQHLHSAGLDLSTVKP